MMKVVPITLKEANRYIAQHHRHHDPVAGHKFSIGASADGELIGVCIVGRPVSRYFDDGQTLEVTRLCTDGSRNACSFLYSRAARVAKELGYKRIITYILKSELGTSLKASGWKLESGDCGGMSWNTPSRPRETEETQLSLFPQRRKYPSEKKQRWSRLL